MSICTIEIPRDKVDDPAGPIGQFVDDRNASLSSIGKTRLVSVALGPILEDGSMRAVAVFERWPR